MWDNYSNSTGWGLSDAQRMMQVASEALWRKEWSKGSPHRLNPNPLTILSRAVNGLKLCHRIVFQPRWKSGRYKAKT